MSGLTADLTALHDRYVESVNLAVAADDLDRVESLVAEYDDEAIRMIIDAEGIPAFTPPVRAPAAAAAATGLRSLVRRLTTRRAA
jgi:hypothetical protein